MLAMAPPRMIIESDESQTIWLKLSTGSNLVRYKFTQLNDEAEHEDKLEVLHTEGRAISILMKTAGVYCTLK